MEKLWQLESMATSEHRTLSLCLEARSKLRAWLQHNFGILIKEQLWEASSGYIKRETPMTVWKASDTTGA